MAGRGTGPFTSWGVRARNHRWVSITALADPVPNTAKQVSWNQWFFGTASAVKSIIVKKLSALGVG